jgi:uncharacterized phage protein (predicted DNA packaging)
MPIVTVPELKAHLRLNDNSEDALLAGFIAVAEEFFTQLTGRTLNDNIETGFPAGIPESLKLAVKLLSSHYFQFRENHTEQNLDALPFGFIAVCRLYSTKFVTGAV